MDYAISSYVSLILSQGMMQTSSLAMNNIYKFSIDHPQGAHTQSIFVSMEILLAHVLVLGQNWKQDLSFRVKSQGPKMQEPLLNYWFFNPS